MGLDTPYYRKLGLIPGKNYITYNGTMEGLIDTVRYYQDRTDETRRIAEAGMHHVRRNFNTEAVANNFFSALEELIEKKHAGRMLK